MVGDATMGPKRVFGWISSCKAVIYVTGLSVFLNCLKIDRWQWPMRVFLWWGDGEDAQGEGS